MDTNLRSATRYERQVEAAAVVGVAAGLCCWASSEHIHGGRTTKNLIKRYIFQLIVSAILGAGVYGIIHLMAGIDSCDKCTCTGDRCFPQWTFDKDKYNAFLEGIASDICPPCTEPSCFGGCPHGEGNPMDGAISSYMDPIQTYLICFAAFGVWPTLFVLYKILQ